MGREFEEAGEVECSGTGEVEDSKRNQLEKEQSWENKACGKDFSCESVEVGTEEMTWDGYEGTSMGGQRATDYSVNSEESGYSSLKDKQVGSQQPCSNAWQVIITRRPLSELRHSVAHIQKV